MPACEGCPEATTCEALLANIRKVLCSTIRRKRNPSLERRILEYIEAYPGITQNQLVRQLPLSSGSISNLIKRLEREGKLTREAVSVGVKGRRRTYRLFMKNPRTSLDSVAGVPCFLCADVDKCGSGETSPNPTSCQKLTSWLEKEL